MRVEDILARVRWDFPEAAHVVVGLSGGADSVLLTHLLTLKMEKSRLCCVHVHHGIRGAGADRDEAFVAAFCRARGLRLAVYKRDVPALAKAAHESLEACARRVRYACFFEAAAENGACVLTAHNADDNAETLLLNLTRGMGPGGAAGIPAVRGNVFRPLLGISRAQVEALCAAFGLSYVTDETNAAEVYTRNRIRHSVLPVLKAVNPAVVESFTRFAESMTVQKDFVEGEARALLALAARPSGLSIPVLKQAHEAVLRAALEIFLSEAGRLEHTHLMEAVRCVYRGGRCSLPRGAIFTALQDTATLTLQPTEPVFSRVQIGENRLSNGKTLLLSLEKVNFEKNTAKIHNLLFKNCLSCDKITDDLFVRTRRAGDAFAPAGRGVTKSVKKLLNEMRVPAAVRDEILLLVMDETVVWMEGAGAAEGFSAAPRAETVLAVSVGT